MTTHPEMQEKLREEINRIFPGEEIESDKLGQLSYMIKFINETMRLSPALAFLLRYVYQDVVLGDWFIPKDTYLQIPVYGLHTDKDIWGEDAEKFNPDRFDNFTKEQRRSFLPFGGGPRICIGNMFSLYEQKIFLTKLLKTFRITLEPGSKLFKANGIPTPKEEFLKYNFEKLN